MDSSVVNIPSKNKEIPDDLFEFVWHYLKYRKSFLLGYLLVTFIWASDMAVSPYLLKVIINQVVEVGNQLTSMVDMIIVPCGLYVGMTIINMLGMNFFAFLNMRLYPSISAEVTRNMLRYVMKHSHEFFQNNFSGSITRKIFDIQSNIEHLINIPNEWFLSRIVALIISSTMLFFVVHPIFSSILIIWAVCFVGLTYYLSKKSAYYAHEMSEADVAVGGAISDTISNIMTAKLFSKIDYEITTIDKRITHYQTCNKKLRKYNLYVNIAQGIGVVILLTCMMIALVYGRIHNWVTAGDFAMVLTLSIAFIFSIFQMGQQIVQFSKIIGICKQSLSIIKEPHGIQDEPDAQTLTVTDGTIRFDGVTFNYGGKKQLFDRLSVDIASGQKVGLVGFSGGGKSSFIKLILRLYDINNGHILIDNQDIKAITLQSLRDNISTIPQEPELFHRTIVDNIRFAKPNANDDEVIEAAKKAHCHDFISDLPEGYQTMVGERGIKLSGGQRQRIAIARAILKDAPILIMDEATSALDSVTERYIHESLKTVMLNKTALVIAHRLSTLKDMDRILVFDHGKIVEDGTMKTLLKNNGTFSRLWKMQYEHEVAGEDLE